MKRLVFILLCFAQIFFLAGCDAEKKGAGNRQSLEFQVVEKEEIPEEMKAMIAKQKEEPFRITYGDQENLYIGRGYGRKETSGYSVRVDECCETDEEIVIHTSLIGPGADEEVSETPTCPYLVVKTKWRQKQVIFEGK